MLKLVVSILSIGLMFSCGSKSDDDAGDGGIAELQGTWSQACTRGTGVSNTASKTVYVISGATATATQTAYNEAATCTTEGLVSTWSGTMAAAGDATTPTGAKKYNFTWATVSQTPKIASYVTAFNTLGLCGITTWALNTETSILGKTCGNTTFQSAGDISYDIYKITGTSLSLGKTDATNTGKTDALRPIALDTVVYTK